MGDRARMWLPGKYVILCCRQSSRPFLLFLKLSTVLPYSNKHFRLPSSHSVHVLCGNTAQTGFVPGARSSRDTGGGQAGDTSRVRACPPRNVQGHTSSSPFRSGNAKLPETGFTEGSLLRPGLPAGGGRCFSLWLGHPYSYCNHLAQDDFSQTGAFLQSLKALVMATVFARHLSH